jgi:hypothetical protein
LLGNRLRELAHACCAWNQVTHAVGCTPAIETAYSGAVHCPLAGKVPGNTGVQLEDGLICVAPPAVRAASVAVPF